MVAPTEMSERMGPILDWQTVALLDHRVIRRDRGWRFNRLSLARNFRVTSMDLRPDKPDHDYDGHCGQNNGHSIGDPPPDGEDRAAWSHRREGNHNRTGVWGDRGAGDCLMTGIYDRGVARR